MTSTVQGAVVATTPQQYVVLNTQQPGVLQGPAETKVGYSRKNKQTVKGLALTQLILGILIFFCQIATTVMDDEVTNRVAKIRRQYNSYGLRFDGFADNAATGIWVGLSAVVAASIGIAGYKQQSKALIITHLILNAFLLAVYVALAGTLSSTIDSLRSCRTRGEYYSSYNSYSDSNSYSAPILFGEKIGQGYHSFYCKHSFFKAWLAIEAILLVCCVTAFFITLVLLIYNSIAACMCCRSSPAQQAPAVVYTTQQPVQQFVQPQAVPQLQAVPQYYSQSVPAQHVQQPTVVASAGTNAAAGPSAPQPAATNRERKGEDLPPEYNTVTPQSN